MILNFWLKWFNMFHCPSELDTSSVVLRSTEKCPSCVQCSSRWAFFNLWQTPQKLYQNSFHQQFARQYSRNEPITFNWLCSQVAWPFSIPKTILDLVHLEAVFDVLDLYLWFSYRFMDIFPDGNLVRDIQSELDEIIQQGVFQITKLLQNSESSSGQSDDGPGYRKRQQKGEIVNLMKRNKLTNSST